MSAYSKGSTAFKKRSSFIVGLDFKVSNYREFADKIAEKSVQPHGVIAFRKNDAVPSHFEFTEAQSANDQFDALSERPGDYVYLYLYRDRKPIDEGYFTATSQDSVKFETKRDRERIGLGWILGGVGLGMLGLAIGGKKK